MKLIARVLRADGSLLPKGRVEVVTLQDGGLRGCGSGRIAKGRLSVQSEVVALWALRIDGLPVWAVPVSVDGDTLDLGDIALLAQPVALPAFHAEAGEVHGLPGALAARLVVQDAAQGAASVRAAAPVPVPPDSKSGMTFGTMLGSTAKQLRDSVVQDAGFRLKSASITLKGVPTATEEAIGLVFPSAAELVNGGIGLSVLSFELNPKVEPVGTTPPVPSGPAVPPLVGYTRELAVRKLAALGYLAQVQGEIVRDAGLAGRVVRQLPESKTVHPAGAVVNLFVGKDAGA